MLTADPDFTTITIPVILRAIQNNQVRISDHADEEAKSDGLSYDSIIYSVMFGQVIESYSSDKPYPSCLVFGMSFQGEPIHSVWAYNRENAWAVLVTVYRPDPERWIHWKERKSK